MKKENPNYVFVILFAGILCCLIIIVTGLFNETPHIHSYGEWTVSVNATCTADGVCERFCDCGSRQQSSVAAYGHEYVSVVEKPADCNESGYIAYEECKRCGYDTVVEIPSLGHDFGEWTTIKPASCTEQGEQFRVCLRDASHRETRVIDMLEHDASEWKLERAATCTDDGTEYRECTFCSARLETRAVPAVGHISTGWIVAKSATCTDEGEEYRECTFCSARLETRAVPAVGHISTDWIVAKPATCTDEGEEYRECTFCSVRLETCTLPAAGHDFGQWQQITAPSCSAFGEETRVCSRDGAHREIRKVDKTEHIPSDWITERLPDCEADGTRRVECTLCSEELARERIPALGHVFEKLYDEVVHYLLCTVCNDVKDRSEHVWGDNACTVCPYDAGGIKGLEWSLGSDGSYYVFCGTGSVKADVFEVPAVHNGKAVTAVGTFGGFEGSTLIIPQTITRIEKAALYGCKNLCSLTVPFIGADRGNQSHLGYFFGADSATDNDKWIPPSLTTVVISEGTYLPDGAFKYCTFVNKIILPDSVEALGDEGFYGCVSLANIALPSGLKIIGSAAFWNCSALESIFIPAGVREIGTFAFFGTADSADVSFSEKTDWFLYDGDKKISEIPENYLSGEGLKVYNKYTWKRITDGA